MADCWFSATNKIIWQQFVSTGLSKNQYELWGLSHQASIYFFQSSGITLKPRSVSFCDFSICFLCTVLISKRSKKGNFIFMFSPPSYFRLPQRTGEQSVADLLVSYKEWTAVVLPRQGQEQSNPTCCVSRGLQCFAWPQPRAPILLSDWHGWHTDGNSRGRLPLYVLYI